MLMVRAWIHSALEPTGFSSLQIASLRNCPAAWARLTVTKLFAAVMEEEALVPPERGQKHPRSLQGL